MFATFQANAQEKNCVVDVKEIKAIDQKEIILIDVRTPEEFNAGHLPGAKLINVKDDDFAKKIDSLDRDKAYYVYCRSGSRSSRAQEIMLKKGFEKVCNAEGGILKMQAENMVLIKEKN